MARGRKRIPTAIRLLKGRSHEAIDDRPEPKFEGKPVCPMWLTPKAKTEWKRIVPKLIRLGVATEADQASLVAYCEAWARIQEASKLLQKEGITIVSTKGQPCKNPAVSTFNDAVSIIMRIATEFGMTPASRTKIRGKVVETKSDLEKFISGGA